MKIRNLLALLLVCCMVVTLFAACSSSENPAPTNTPNSGNNGGNGDDQNPPDDGGDDDDDDGEITTINFYWQDNGNVGSSSGTPAVEEAVNAITEKEIGVHVNFVWIANADYATQVTLAVGNKEAVDVLTMTPQAAGSYLTFYSNGIVQDMSPWLDNEGKDVKALLGDLLNATSVDGKVYAIPTYRILNSNFYLAFREDILTEMNMTYENDIANMKTWADYEAFMEAAKNSGIAGMYAIGHGEHTLFGDRGTFFCGDSFADSYSYDILGDSLGVVWTDQEGHVENAMARDELHEMLQMAARWNAAGYIYPDTAYSGESTEQMCGQGLYASFFIQSEFGVDVNKSQTVGKPMRCLEIVPGILTSTQCQKFAVGIGTSSLEPAAAMKFINLVYTNADLMNLLIYGVEGSNYEVVDGEACYIGDADASTSGYHGMGFSLGNQFLLWPWDGEGKDFRTDAMENFKAAPISEYMGLAVSTEGKDTLVSAIFTVTEEYWPQLSAGLYTDSLYNEFMEKLDAAGIDDYVAMYQAAVDDFIA